jgi:hypothetical protein
MIASFVSEKENESPPRVQIIPAQQATSTQARIRFRVCRRGVGGGFEEAELALDSFWNTDRLMIHQHSLPDVGFWPGIVSTCVSLESA